MPALDAISMVAETVVPPFSSWHGMFDTKRMNTKVEHNKEQETHFAEHEW